tara:strand:+ start:1595 stop:1765 length:171 start_codon:yes stop_codon:yes gene_type:complete
MAETTTYVDLTPAPEGYFETLWMIANNSENASNREWAKEQIKEGYVLGLKKETGVE